MISDLYICETMKNRCEKRKPSPPIFRCLSHARDASEDLIISFGASAPCQITIHLFYGKIGEMKIHMKKKNFANKRTT